MLAECLRLDASDLHLAPNLPPHFRIHGVLEPRSGAEPITPEILQSLADELARGLNRASLEATGSLDGAFSAPDGTRFRFNIFRRQGELAIALRRLEDRFRSLAELGMPEVLYELCSLSDGLVVVAGPTGSGKSTTLATLLDRINESRRCHLVTIEDPIEYVHASKMCLVNQRQVGLDTSGFYEALVASLRQDPDVILVGEIRDLNTIRTAITAAETGHLVFTTVHAGDCVGAIERLVSVFPADEQIGIRRQLAMVLRAIVAQHLVVADGTNMAANVAPGKPGEEASESQPAKRGRVVVSEVLRIHPGVANLIATGKSSQVYSLMETGAAQGMQTLEHDLARLLQTGRISENTAMMLARNPQVLQSRMSQLRQRSAGPRRGGGIHA